MHCLQLAAPTKLYVTILLPATRRISISLYETQKVQLIYYRSAIGWDIHLENDRLILDWAIASDPNSRTSSSLSTLSAQPAAAVLSQFSTSNFSISQPFRDTIVTWTNCNHRWATFHDTFNTTFTFRPPHSRSRQLITQLSFPAWNTSTNQAKAPSQSRQDKSTEKIFNKTTAALIKTFIRRARLQPRTNRCSFATALTRTRDISNRTAAESRPWRSSDHPPTN